MGCSPQVSSVHGISRQEYWSGLPFPSPGDLPNPGIKPMSPAFQADSLLSKPPGKPINNGYYMFDHCSIQSECCWKDKVESSWKCGKLRLCQKHHLCTKSRRSCSPEETGKLICSKEQSLGSKETNIHPLEKTGNFCFT